MLSKKMEKALNNQINAELYSSYLYLSMAAYFEATNLPGFAHWMREQAREENEHAMKIYEYITERGGRVILQKIEAPPSEWASPLAAFENAFKHEQTVTSSINTLVNQAVLEKDHATHNMLQWFVNEQVEEEAIANDIVQKLKLVGNSGGGLFMMDRELAKRS